MNILLKESNKKVLADRIWPALHLLAITYPENNDDIIKQAYAKLFESISVLYPDPSKSNNIISFMKEYPIDRYFNSSVKLLQWTYLMDNMVNGTKTSFENILKIYDKNKIDKPRWGNAVWNMIHTLAKYLPQNLTHNQKYAFKNMIIALQYLLPCSKCRNHMMSHLKKYPIDKYLVNRDAIFLWTVTFHNIVNVSLNKNPIDVRDAWILY